MRILWKWKFCEPLLDPWKALSSFWKRNWEKKWIWNVRSCRSLLWQWQCMQFGLHQHSISLKILSSYLRPAMEWNRRACVLYWWPIWKRHSPLPYVPHLPIGSHLTDSNERWTIPRADSITFNRFIIDSILGVVGRVRRCAMVVPFVCTSKCPLNLVRALTRYLQQIRVIDATFNYAE